MKKFLFYANVVCAVTNAAILASGTGTSFTVFVIALNVYSAVILRHAR